MKINDLLKFNFEDLKCIFILLLSLIPSFFLRLRYNNIWLFLERPQVADDNAWMLFQWIRKKHPEINAFFLLNSTATSFNPEDPHFIPWGGFRHYIYFLAANIRVTASFNKARPSMRICSYVDQYFKKSTKVIYVRHGIHKDGPEMHLYSLHHFRLFVCGAKPEYDYMREVAGYPEDNIKYLGLARFDDLLLNRSKKGFILLIPTWRRYVGAVYNLTKEENENEFIQSSFFRHYSSLLNNPRLIEFLSKSGLKLRFCLHAYYKGFEHLFQTSCPNIEIVDSKESIHKLLMENDLLITDYSSVFFDAAYAEKPVMFYHFDYEEFRSKHFSEGYFSYENDGFGPVIKDEDTLVNTIITSYRDGEFVTDPVYVSRIKNFFPLHDNNNCQRIFDEILKIQKNG